MAEINELNGNKFENYGGNVSAFLAGTYDIKEFTKDWNNGDIDRQAVADFLDAHAGNIEVYCEGRPNSVLVFKNRYTDLIDRERALTAKGIAEKAGKSINTVYIMMNLVIDYLKENIKVPELFNEKGKETTESNKGKVVQIAVVPRQKVGLSEQELKAKVEEALAKKDKEIAELMATKNQEIASVQAKIDAIEESNKELEELRVKLEQENELRFIPKHGDRQHPPLEMLEAILEVSGENARNLYGKSEEEVSEIVNRLGKS